MEYRISYEEDLSELISSLFDVESSLTDVISQTFLVNPVIMSDGSIVNRFTHEKIVNSRGFGTDGRLISEICYPFNEKLSLIDEFLSGKNINLGEIRRALVDNDILLFFSPEEKRIINTQKISKIQKTEELKTTNEETEVKNCPLASIFVIDVSASMDCTVGESSNTLLELVIYITCLNIIAMKETDEIAIISFSERAEIVQEPTRLTDKNAIIEKIKKLKTKSSTSIGLGLKQAFEVLDFFSCHQKSIHLFTDGQETRNSGRLSQFIENNIPNFNEEILHLYGFSQSVSITELMSISPSSLIYYINDISVLMTSLFNGFVNSRLNKVSLSINNENIRNKTCAILELLISCHQNRRSQILSGYVDELRNLETNPFIEGLILDFEETSDPNLGQISKAIDKNFYGQWGKNYLVSYLSGMRNSVALNFKDNAQKFFLTKEKNTTINYLENLLNDYTISDFISTRKNSSYQQVNNNSSYRQQVSNSSLYNTRSGCFHPHSLIMSTNGLIRICDVDENTFLISGDSTTKAVKRTKFYYSGEMYKINQHVLLTPYHPYRKDGNDFFPIENHETILHYEGYVYDLVLENRGLITTLDKIEIASLCHKEKSEKFCHNFFSTELPMEILNRKSTFQVEIESFQRDEESRLITGFTIKT